MAERITRKQIESKFAQLVAVLQMNAGYAPGSLALNSQNPGDGKRRYQIVVMEENGGESHAHFGARQWSGQEIYWQMDAMLNALTMSRRPPAGSQDNYYAGLATRPYWHHAVAEKVRGGKAERPDRDFSCILTRDGIIDLAAKAAALRSDVDESHGF